MDLFPAIDIRNGRVVRLRQGEPARQTVYGNDPVTVAEEFVQQGARWLHVVDLDRAFGVGSNLEAIGHLIDQMGRRVQVQLGGGFRDLDSVRRGLELGAARVIVGTAAVLHSELIPAAVRAFGAERLAVGLDVRHGLLAVRGWTETSSRRADEVAATVVRDGITTLIYTDVSRDGLLVGPDLSGAAALQEYGARVIASGGVASTADIAAACAAGLAGVIVGRALYEGRVSLVEGLKAADCSPVG